MWLGRRELLKLGAAGAGFAALGTAAFVGTRHRPDLLIGAKNFPEQWILAELLASTAATTTGQRVARLNLQGTLLCHEALKNGDILAYVEYTGTGLTEILRLPLVTDPGEVYQIVAREYRRQLGLRWLSPLGFQNTFAVLVRRAEAERSGLRTIGDLARIADRARLAMPFEFHDRPDGYRVIRDGYGIDLAVAPQEMALGNIYRAMEAARIDVGVGNSTDGLIAHLDLVILEDDRHLFPPYQPAVVLREETARQRPELVAAFEHFAGTITPQLMGAANYQVDSGKRHPAPVAAELAAELTLRSPSD